MKEKKLTLITPKELVEITLEKKKGQLKKHTGILIKGKDLEGDVLIVLDKLIKSKKMKWGYIG